MTQLAACPRCGLPTFTAIDVDTHRRLELDPEPHPAGDVRVAQDDTGRAKVLQGPVLDRARNAELALHHRHACTTTAAAGTL